MSVEEQLSPLEVAEVHTNAIYQAVVAVNLLRARHPAADLSPIRAELEQMRDFINSSIEEWK